MTDGCVVLAGKRIEKPAMAANSQYVRSIAASNQVGSSSCVRPLPDTNIGRNPWPVDFPPMVATGHVRRQL